MKSEKNVHTFNNEFITVSYTKNFFDICDTNVSIYEKHKISIELSDGLNAVVKNKIINTGKYCLTFFRPDEPHCARFTEAGEHAFIDFFIPESFFDFIGISDKDLIFLCDTSDTRINCIFPDGMLKKEIADIAKKTLDALNSDLPLCNIELLSVTLRIILLCTKYYEVQKLNPTNRFTPAIIAKTLDYITENYEQKISLIELAELCNCSIAYLSRTFKKYTGTTIYNHIIITRIQNAQLLLNNGSSVNEACFASGFEDCSNFIKTFKKLTGKTPKSFKQIN